MNDVKELYNKARQACKSNDKYLAYNLYKEILISDSNSIEAEFYLTYYRAINSKVADFWSVSIDVMDIEKKIFYSIKHNINSDEQDYAIKSACNYLYEVSDIFFKESIKYYHNIDLTIKEDFVSVFVSTLSVAAEILYICGDELENEFGKKYSSYSVTAWKKAVEDNCNYVRYVTNQTEHLNTINKYSEKIRIYDKGYKNPPIKIFGKPENLISSTFRKIKGLFR